VLGPDGKYFTSAGEDGSVAPLLLSNLSGEFSNMSHPEGALSVAFSPDGKPLASGKKGETPGQSPEECRAASSGDTEESLGTSPLLRVGNTSSLKRTVKRSFGIYVRTNQWP